jgi:formylglycine-generating enzyme required for sulfatase activity
MAVFLESGCWSDDDGGPAPDTTPPAAVSDLSVTAVTDSSMTLEWMAPGDDGTKGTASEYDIRYATDLITDENWSTADSVDTPPPPQSAGSEEVFTVDGLSSGTPYYFALKTVDDASNWSGLSNVPSDTTTAGSQPEEPLLVISPDSLDLGSEEDEAIFTITNAGTGTLHWTVTEDETWLTVSPDSGSTTAEADGITVTVDRTGLDPGGYSGAVTVTPDEGTPQHVGITMTVSGSHVGAMVLISSGMYEMGSPTDEPNRHSNETQHWVRLSQGFYLCETEVTNQECLDAVQWAYDQGHVTVTSSSVLDNLDGSTQELLDLDDVDCRIDFSGGVFSLEDAGDADHPAVEVTWYGAARYCDWMSLQAGYPRAYDHDGDWACNGGDPYGARGYRLPTESEWEYACRGGTNTPFNTGSCLDADGEANYNGNYPYAGCPSGVYRGDTTPVGTFPANAWGLHDMHGNVWEWCADWHGAYPDGPQGDPAEDPTGLETGTRRAVRGGCWSYYAQSCRSAHRSDGTPDYCSQSIGFRVARSHY